MPQPRNRSGETDRYGFDDTRDHLGAAVSRLLPGRLLRRGLSVSVETDGDVYAPGDPIGVRVELRNAYPVPVEVATASRRRWGWEIDGLLEGSDEPRRDPGGRGALAFRARERKSFAWTWDGRVKQVTDDRERSVPLDPGEHELRAFLATASERPAATTTFRIE
ncbi:hypothetical protein [Halobaculum roseum]|uniref:DUF7974 domain-containing protein n=1 Tax=Halobaculum roseum TaxID=2175149 RepID=A0ABD5MPF0_9EURY|nr:hypothetical protein [Halobaculum roseum]QZY03948.1 hypothetical protein K6T36_07245 [Halobaculum roseum]